MEGRHGLAKNRLAKRKKVQFVSPQLFSTELRYPEFSSRLRVAELKSWELTAAQDFKPFSTAGGMLNIVGQFGLNHHPHLHKVLETEDKIKQCHVAAAFYHCAPEDVFRQHHEEQKALKAWRADLGHRASAAPSPLAGGSITTIEQLSWKACVEQVQTRLRVGDWLMCRMEGGVRFIGSEEQRVPHSAGMDDRLMDLFRGLPVTGGSTVGDTEAAAAAAVPEGTAAEEAAPQEFVVLRHKRKAGPSLQSLGQIRKMCCVRVLHTKPIRVKRGPTESLVRPPRSDQIAVSVHKVLSFDPTTGLIGIDYTPAATRSGASAGSLDGCAFLSLDVLVGHATRRDSMVLLERKGPAEFKAHIDVPGFDGKLVHRVANRLIDASAVPALRNIAETEQALALRSSVPDDQADIGVGVYVAFRLG